MSFFKLEQTYSNWRYRVSEESLTTLEKNGLVICQISDSGNNAHLIIDTEEGLYVTGTDDCLACPEATLKSLTLDTSVKMPPPVRVAAVNRLLAA